MTSTTFVWSAVDRADALKTIIGRPDNSGAAIEFIQTFSAPDFSRDFALARVAGADGSLAPAMIVVDKERIEDLFAWLATYAPDVFPLSQYVRVLSKDEWMHTTGVAASTKVDADPIWPSLILGELLAQGSGFEYKVTSVPLSRVSLCLAYTQARASTLYRSSPDLLRIAADRLGALEKADKQWRTVATKELRETWALAEDAFALDPFVSELMRLLSWTFDRNREQRGETPPVPDMLRDIALDLRKLASGPLEYRVEEFERASAKLLARKNIGEDDRRRVSALLAALALWVGAGTSHVSLLAEVATVLPSTLAWFGAFAGALGPTAWHADWARTTAAIAKMLRSGFDIAATSTADLSWTEFAWFSSIGSFDLMAGVPRASAKILSVDILPGAAAPFRLSADEGAQAPMNIAKHERQSVKSEAQPQPTAYVLDSAERLKGSPALTTLTVEQADQLAGIAQSLADLLNQVKTVPKSEEPFELKPSQSIAVKKSSATSRKAGKRPSTRKVS